MNRKPRLPLLLAFVGTATALTACGGGGSGASSPPAPPPTPAATLIAISLSPPTAALTPGGTVQLTVTGSYSDGSASTLAASNETFSSSNTAAATVSATGLVTVPANAAVGTFTTIGATDTASRIATTATTASVVTVAVTGSSAPTATSVTAVTATAQNNARCTAIQPFYWEIGGAASALASGSATPAGGTAVTADSRMLIASASKWIYGMYVVQMRGGAANLTPADIRFLTFTSGYTYMGSDTSARTCTAPTSGADSVNACLTLPSTAPGKTFASQNPATTGVFDYDAGHEQNHAGQFQPEINALDTSVLGATIAGGMGLGSSITLRYNQPLLAGGIFASANDYSPALRAILGGQLGMLGALGTNPVCAWVGPTCNAASSPQFTEHWHYSIAHWVEDDTASGDDGAFSSPGAFGFYPWIEANKRYYGVIARTVPTGTGEQNGFNSALCGRVLRAAWETGVPQ